MRILEGHSGAVYTIAFSPDGGRLVSGGKDGRLIVFSVVANTAPQIIDLSANYLASIASRRESDRLGAGDLRTDDDAPNGTYIWSVAVSPDGNVVAVAHTLGVLLIQGGTSFTPLQSRMNPASAAAVAYCSGGRVLVAGLGHPVHPTVPGALIAYFNNQSAECIRRGSNHGVTAVAASPAGKLVLWGGGDKRVTRWELTAQDHRLTQPHRKEIRAIALSPDGRQFAATDDYDIRIYDVESMQLQRIISGHKGRVDTLAYLPDGRLLSGAWDKSVGIWDPDTGREIAAHDWGVGNVRAVAVSSDGVLAAAAGDRGTIVLWDLDS